MNSTGGDIVGGPGITTTEASGTVTISADLTANGGLEFSGTGNDQEIRVDDGNGIVVNANGVNVGAGNGITVNADDVAINLNATNPGLAVDVNGLRTDGNQTNIGTVQFGSGDTYTFPTSDGTANQVLVTDGSGTLSWGTNSSDNTTYDLTATDNGDDANINLVPSSGTTDTVTIAAGTNVTVDHSGSTITINSTASGGGITVEDEGSALTTDATTLNFTGAGVTASGTGATKTINIPGTDTNTTYDLTVPASTTDIRLAGSNGTNDDITITGGTNVTVTRTSATELTINSTGGTGGVDVEDDGTSIVTGATTFNFTGGGVTVTDAGSNEATVNIPSPGSGGVTFRGTVNVDDDNTLPATAGQQNPNDVAVGDSFTVEETIAAADVTTNWGTVLQDSWTTANGDINSGDVIICTTGAAVGNRTDARYNLIRTGGAANTLQQVTDAGNTTTNGATFGGFVQSNSAFFTESYFDAGVGFNGDPGVRIDNTGFIEIRGDNASAFRLKPTTGNPTITLNANGSAQFNSFVGIGASGGGTANDGLFLSQNGTVTATATDNANLWTGFQTGTTGSTSRIDTRGNATFASNVNAGPNPGQSGNNTNGVMANGSLGAIISYKSDSETSNALIVSKHNGTSGSEVASISHDGAASFANRIRTGDNIGNANATGISIWPTGTITLANDNSGAGDLIFRAFTTGDTTAKISMSADGSAVFGSGDVTMAANGNSTFGTVQSGGNALNGTDAGVLLRGDNGMIHVTSPASGSAVWHGFTEGNATPTSTILANGSATFDGTITSTVNSGAAFNVTSSANQQTWSRFTQGSPGVADMRFGVDSASTAFSAGGGGLIWNSGNSPISIGTNDTERVRIDADGRMILMSSPGIQFGSTNSGGDITSQTLDDYEEGTFTPRYLSGLDSPTYTAQVGHYTKIGNIVHFNCRVQLSGGTEKNEHLQLGDLPFTPANNNTTNGTGAYITRPDGLCGTESAPPTLWFEPGNARVQFFNATTGANWNSNSGDGIVGQNLFISGTYRVAG